MLYIPGVDIGRDPINILTESIVEDAITQRDKDVLYGVKQLLREHLGNLPMYSKRLKA
jgi:hypothetical protein